MSKEGIPCGFLPYSASALHIVVSREFLSLREKSWITSNLRNYRAFHTYTSVRSLKTIILTKPINQFFFIFSVAAIHRIEISHLQYLMRVREKLQEPKVSSKRTKQNHDGTILATATAAAFTTTCTSASTAAAAAAAATTTATTTTCQRSTASAFQQLSAVSHAAATRTGKVSAVSAAAAAVGSLLGFLSTVGTAAAAHSTLFFDAADQLER
jgi:hypothetical protein